jgi:hypothetical protein
MSAQDVRSSVHLRHEIELIVERLQLEFTEIDPSVVGDVVHRCVAYFDDAPIQTFVPLLAEKRARERLRAGGSTLGLPYLAIGA